MVEMYHFRVTYSFDSIFVCLRRGKRNGAFYSASFRLKGRIFYRSNGRCFMGKRFLTFLTTLAMSVTLTLAFAACSGSTDSESSSSSGNVPTSDSSSAGSEGSSESSSGVHTCSFVCEVAEAKYICTEATCASAATYYYSCECGAVGTSTFEYGSPLEHDYGAWTSNNDGTHSRVCSRDEAHTETKDCNGGTALVRFMPFA